MDRQNMMHTDLRHWTISAVCIILLIVLSLVGCGDDEAEFQNESVNGRMPTVALPLGETDPHAFTEEFFAQNPEAAQSPGHIAILRLEPTGTHEGDTGTAEGVDHVPYFFEQEIQLRLRIHQSAEPVQRVVVKDWSGREVVRQEQGMEPTTITIQPGAYILEVHHARKGEADAPVYTLFLRPVFEAPDVSATTTALVQADASPLTTLEVSQDCQNCDFTLADLEGQNFDNLNLSGSKFRAALLSGASFRNAVMQNCDLSSKDALARTEVTHADFTSANLTGAKFNGTQGDSVIFTGAILKETIWGPILLSDVKLLVPAQICGDFRHTNAQGAKFAGTDFGHVGVDKCIGRCSFQGALLVEADFRAPSGLNFFGEEPLTTNVTGCDFSQEPSTGTKTVFILAHLSSLDLTDVNLSHAVFSSTFAQGTVFMGANLSHAGGILLPSEGVSIGPSNVFAGKDLTRTDFSGFDFSGYDLSQTDLSQALISGETKFVNAKLSDGVAHGINLSGHTFPPQYTQFKSKDLRYANLSRVNLFEADLEGSRFDHATLDEANLSGAILAGADFTDAQLRHATLPADLRQVTLVGANLTGVDLSSANLQGTNLTDAQLIDVNLSAAQLQQAILVSAQLNGANLNFANLEGANLCEAQLSKSPITTAATSLEGAYLKNVNLAHADLSGASMINVNFYSSIATDTCAPDNTCTIPTTCASAVGATMNSTTFTGAYLNGVDMTNSTPQGAKFSGALLVGVNFTRANLSNDSNTGAVTDFSNAFLQGANFTNTTVTNTDFTSAYVDLTSANGATMVFLLSSEHTGFTDYWNAAETPVCVEFTYTAPTTVPATNSTNTCPDGTSGPCSSTQWQSPKIPISQAQPPSTSDPNDMLPDNCSFKTVDIQWILE